MSVKFSSTLTADGVAEACVLEIFLKADGTATINKTGCLRGPGQGEKGVAGNAICCPTEASISLLCVAGRQTGFPSAEWPRQYCVRTFNLGSNSLQQAPHLAMTPIQLPGFNLIAAVCPPLACV